MASKSKTKGIFCLEGDWDLDLRQKTTVQPLFELLERSNHPSIPSIRRDIGTIPELEYYLRKSCLKRYEKYPILYLGFHGTPGCLELGDRGTEVDLDWLEERLEGKCRGKVIHFGSCGTMDIHGSRLNRLLTRTNALAICGYRNDVDWMLSAAFELVLLCAFQEYSFSKRGMEAVQRMVKEQTPGLVRDLDFRMVVRK